MPLRDHFQPPLSDVHPWESFLAAWATEIMRTLNRRVLSHGCFAAAQVHVGSRVEIDVATFEREPSGAIGETNGGSLATAIWAPPATTPVMPVFFPDDLEVQVFRRAGGATLVGAIELISPGNKDRHEAWRAFVAKCASYLLQGIGLAIVDTVTERQANLHDELVHLLDQPEQFGFAQETARYTAAYRPSRSAAGTGSRSGRLRWRSDKLCRSSLSRCEASQRSLSIWKRPMPRLASTAERKNQDATERAGRAAPFSRPPCATSGCPACS